MLGGERHLEIAVLGDHRRVLLQVERIAFGGGGDARGQRVELRAREQNAGQPYRFILGERLERDGHGATLPAGPAGALVQKLGTGEAEDENGGPDVVDDRIEQLEQRRLRPVDIVDDDQQRPRLGEPLEQPTERPGSLSRGGTRTDPQEVREPVGHGLAVGRSGEEGAQGICDDLRLGDGAPRRRVQHLEHGREGLAFAVGGRVTHEHRRLGSEAARQLLRQPGLADAG